MWSALSNSEDESHFGDEERVDKVLMGLFFVFFAVIGYALFHFM
jgi:hypothetical protein